MSDFKAEMHQIRFPLGLPPDPAGRAYSAPPDPLAVFKGPTSKGREGERGKGRKGGGKGKERLKEEKGREGKGCPSNWGVWISQCHDTTLYKTCDTESNLVP